MTDRLLVTSAYHFPTELGWMAIAWRGERLIRTAFGHPSAAAAAAHLDLAESQPVADRRDLPAWVADLVSRLEAYAVGEQVSFDDVPVDLSHMTAFQQKVVRACRKISRGKTRTYGELAAAAGSPGASRAVGSVMANNRLPIVIPCHRVVGAGGSIGGFSAPDGLDMKRRMLALEGLSNASKPQRTRGARRVKANSYS
jgi:methylated-DNA-[protein]-cysteine S-methyltransferase